MGIIDRLFGIEKKVSQQVGKRLATEVNEALRKHVSPGASAVYNSGGRSHTYGGSQAGGAKYPYGLSGDGAGYYIDHWRMRQNARLAYHDSLDARAIIDRKADVVVDSGLVLEPMPRFEVLGITTEQAEQWSEMVEQRFDSWARDKKQHRAGSMSFYQAQRLYSIGSERENDNFVRLFYSGRSDLQNPLQFDFLDPMQIRGDAYTSTWGPWTNDDGIVRNPDGSEKSYKVWLREPGKPGQYTQVEIPRMGPRSKRIMVLHGYNQEYAGQGRGYSRIGFALQELQNLTDFSMATIKKAINQSNMVFGVENEAQDPSNPLEGITSGRSAIGTSAIVDALSDVETINVQGPTVPEVCPIPEAGLDTPGSMAFVNLEQGDKIKMLENASPADNFKDFVEAFTARLAAAASVPIEVVLMKFANNYSASRATLVMFWRIAQIWREEMATDFLNPVYEMWLSEEIAAGRISAPGWSDPRLRAAWLHCTWIGAPMPNIDPVKEAKASKEYLEMGATTQNRVSRNLNGSRADANIAKNAKMFPKTPVPPWSKGRANEEVLTGSVTPEDRDGAAEDD